MSHQVVGVKKNDFVRIDYKYLHEMEPYHKKPSRFILSIPLFKKPYTQNDLKIMSQTPPDAEFAAEITLLG